MQMNFFAALRATETALVPCRSGSMGNVASVAIPRSTGVSPRVVGFERGSWPALTPRGKGPPVWFSACS